MQSMTDSEITDLARAKALDHWAKRCAVYLCVGYLDPEKPAYREGDVLYWVSIAGQSSAQAETYCRVYNQTVDELIRLHGIPDWAPLRKIISISDAVAYLIEGGRPMAEFEPQNSRERACVRHVVNRWPFSWNPIVWCRRLAQGLLLLGGDLTGSEGRIEVIDLEATKWLQSFRFVKASLPVQPWISLLGN